MSKGLKRICMNCGMRFYDLDKSPIICPSCDTKFTGEEKTKARRGRASATPEVPAAKEAPIKTVEEDEDDVEDIDADDDIVALDDDEEDGADDDDNKDDETLTIDSDPDYLDDPEDDLEEDLDEEEDDK